MLVWLVVAIPVGAVGYCLCAFLFWKFMAWLENKGLIALDGFAYLPEWIGVLLLLFLLAVWPIGFIPILLDAGVTLFLALIGNIGDGAHHLFAHIIAGHPSGEGSSLCKIYDCKTCCCKGHSFSGGTLSL